VHVFFTISDIYRSARRDDDPCTRSSGKVEMERDVKCFFGESFFAFLMKPMLPLFWFSRAEWVIVQKDMCTA